MSDRVGSNLCYWILTYLGKVISSSTVQHVNKEDYEDPAIKVQINTFICLIDKWLNDANFVWHHLTDGALHLEDEHDPIESTQTGIVPTDEEYGDMIEEPLLDVDDIGRPRQVSMHNSC